jgi:hypothetical protein
VCLGSLLANSEWVEYGHVCAYGRARERDEKQIAHWKKYVWPRIKKKR